MGFSVGAVMLETSGSIAGHWSIIAATAGCQNRVTARRGLLEVVMEMDSGRCSQTHLSIIAVSIVIHMQKREVHMTKISPNFSFRSVFFLRKLTSILIKMSYARWVADCGMEMGQDSGKHGSVNKTERFLTN